MDLLSTIAVWLREILGPGGLGLATWFVDHIMAILRAVLLGTYALLGFMFLTWLERKLIGRIQDRLGPTYAGPLGILQPIADGVKTITKEIIFPRGVDRGPFILGPVLAAMAALAVFAVIPFGPDSGNGALVGTSLNVGLIYVLAVGAAGVVAIIAGGCGANNKFALLGTFRAVAQLISYEVPQFLSLVTVAMLAGTLDMAQIVNAKTVPFLLPLFVTSQIFLLSGVAESGRSPFDLLEADSEIVAGFHVEYSAMMFALVQMAEYIHAFAIASIFAVVFLNGWAAPVAIAPYLWFILKSFGVFLILIWFRGTLPRFRIDQMMAFNWKFLVPVSIVNVIMVAVVDTLLRTTVGWSSTHNAWAWGLAMFAANLALLFVSLGIAGRAGRRARDAALAGGRLFAPTSGK